MEFDYRTTESGGDELERVKKMASAASTVATSSGGGGSTIGHGILWAQSGFLPSWVELKVCGLWSDIRGTRITTDEVKALIAQIKSNSSHCTTGEIGLAWLTRIRETSITK